MQALVFSHQGDFGSYDLDFFHIGICTYFRSGLRGLIDILFLSTTK